MKRDLSAYKLQPKQLVFDYHPSASVSVTKAAEVLGVSVTTIRRMIQDGTLEGYKRRRHLPNSHFQVTRESIRSLIDDWKEQVATGEYHI